MDDESAVFRQINLRRVQIGLFPLRANSSLSTAARAHSRYLAGNNTRGHFENSSSTGYTGTGPGQRISAASYPWAEFSEVIAYGQGSGALAIEYLLEAIYHRFGIFNTTTVDVGAGWITSHPTYGAALTVDFGRSNDTASEVTSEWVGTYPYDGQTDVSLDFFSDEESPDPVPDANRVGYPISIHINAERSLTISAFTITDAAGNAIPAIQLKPGGDSYTPKSVAALIPRSPLSPDASYTVSFRGRNSGEPFSKTWRFTTAPRHDIELSPANLCVERGKAVSAYLSGGSGSYTRVWWNDVNLMSVTFKSGNQITITGKGLGVGKVSIIDSGNSQGETWITVAETCASQATPEDRVFNWIESMFPYLFEPKGIISRSVGDVYFRHYSVTDSFIATQNGILYFYDPHLAATPLVNLGPVEPFLSMAIEAGY